MIGFIGLFDTVHEYTIQVTVTHSSVHSHVFTIRCSVAASNNGHSDIPLPLASLTISGLNYQLLTTAECEQFSNSLTE
jgi:uncharacterized Zn-finger protein